MMDYILFIFFLQKPELLLFPFERLNADNVRFKTSYLYSTFVLTDDKVGHLLLLCLFEYYYTRCPRSLVLLHIALAI